jgi:sigma-E factor negative regulatory protein RseB
MAFVDIKKLSLLLLLPLTVMAADADKIVEKMIFAMNDLNYEGTYVYSYGDRLETIQLTHTNNVGLRTETLLSLTGEAREIIRTNDTVSCVLPANKAVIIDKARTQFASINKLTFHSATLKKHYSFRAMGEDRIAGQKVYVIHIDPNDEYRYAHTLWIAKEHHLLLKSKLSDEKNHPVEQIIFTDIRLLKRNDLLPILSVSNKRFSKLHTIKNKTKELSSNHSNWSFDNVPPGYELKQYFKKTMNKQGQEIKQWLFSDGLISYSVFIREVGTEQKMPEKMIKLGSINVYSKQLNQYLITVMGEVPAKTVMLASTGIVKN